MKIIVDKMPRLAMECPFSDARYLSPVHTCRLQRGVNNICDLDCGAECGFLKEEKKDAK